MHNFGTCILRTAAQWQNLIFPTSKHIFFLGFCHHAEDLKTKVTKVCTDLDLGLLYILILGTYSKFARKNNSIALGVCFPQPCSSADRRFAASRSRLQNYRRIVVSTTKSSMKYVVNWIPLKIRVRSRNTQPHLKRICSAFA